VVAIVEEEGSVRRGEREKVWEGEGVRKEYEPVLGTRLLLLPVNQS
jgi:hypothetical protein